MPLQSACRCSCRAIPAAAWSWGRPADSACQQRIRLGPVRRRWDAPYVNNATGLRLGFALRLGRPSELTRITLHREM
jgi:hypothetical protein